MGLQITRVIKVWGWQDFLKSLMLMQPAFSRLKYSKTETVKYY